MVTFTLPSQQALNTQKSMLLVLCHAMLGATGGKATNASLDWTTRGVVPPVKDQGELPLPTSLWYATAAAVASARAIASGTLVELSASELAACVNSSFPSDGFDWVVEHGLCSADAYPASTPTPGMCRSTACTSAVSMQGSQKVAPKEEHLDVREPQGSMS